MNIESIAMSKLRNAEHLQFHTDVITLINKYSAGSLGIDQQFNGYTAIVSQEKESLNVITKSVSTDNLAEADTIRDNAYRGIRNMVKAYTFHYKEAIKQAADKVKIVFDTYGDVASKSYNQETAELSALVTELQAAYAPEIQQLGLNEWIIELKKENDIFDDIKNNRYSEEASKSSDRMKDLRTETDEIYNTIKQRVDAFIIINGEQNYKGFVSELNLRIDTYNKTVAQRKGRSKEEEVVEG